MTPSKKAELGSLSRSRCGPPSHAAFSSFLHLFANLFAKIIFVEVEVGLPRKESKRGLDAEFLHGRFEQAGGFVEMECVRGADCEMYFSL